MKKIKLIFSALVIAGLMSAFSYAENLKIGYVDLSRLFDEYYKTKQYDQELEVKSSAFEKDRNAKVEKIQDEMNKLGVLAADKKADKEKEIEQMKTDLLEYDKQKKNDLTKERNEKIREILLEIEKIVSNFANKEKYNMILNDRVLIYGDQPLNITEDVLKVLNNSAPASAQTPAPAAKK